MAVLDAVGFFAAAWAAGFVVLIAPAGAGAREVALAGLLGSAVPDSTALAATLASRLALTLADVAWALLAAAGSGLLRREHSQGDAPPPLDAA